jgi:hypothetical protein
MEPEFSLLHQALRGLDRHLLLRECYFTKLAECYESIVFKPLPTARPLPFHHAEPIKPKADDTKVDLRIEEVLQLAKSVVSGKRAKSTPKPAVPKLKRPTKKAPAVVDNRALIMSSSSLEQLVEFKTKSRASLKATKQHAEELKTRSEDAKTSFLSTLRSKCRKTNDLTPLDRKVAEICAGFSLMKEIKQILEDDEITESFQQIAGKQGDHEQLSSVCKAKFILSWMRAGIEHLESASALVHEVDGVVVNASLELKRRLEGATSLTTQGRFDSERKLHSSLLQGDYEEADRLKVLDSWRIEAEIEKFIKLKGPNVKSLEGLRTLHSLGVKRGRSLCTMTAK